MIYIRNACSWLKENAVDKALTPVANMLMLYACRKNKPELDFGTRHLCLDSNGDFSHYYERMPYSRTCLVTVADKGKRVTAQYIRRQGSLEKVL